MTNNRYPALRRDITAPKNHRAMHEHYVRAINGALEAGRDQVAYELATAYAKDLGAPETRAPETH
jgi:hypothetical protein